MTAVMQSVVSSVNLHFLICDTIYIIHTCFDFDYKYLSGCFIAPFVDGKDLSEEESLSHQDF